jgi:hypothetical protein
MSRRILFSLLSGAVAACLFSVLAALPASAVPVSHPGGATGASTTAAAHTPAAHKPVTRSPHWPAGPVPGGFSTWPTLYAAQNRLDAAATRIASASRGNASIVVNAAHSEVRVYWHGTVPASIRALARRLGVNVAFHPAAFTFRTLVAEARRLAGDSRVVVGASAKPDGSGLNVTVTTSTRPASERALQASSSIPLAIKTGKRSPAFYSRQGDIPAYFGGSRYYTQAGGCSNGFALSVSNDPNVWELTAGHCSGNNWNADGQAANIPGQSTPTGTLYLKSACRDTLLIYYPSGVAGYIYTGAYNSSSDAPVSGATPDYVGDYIETGGASSGENFNIQVQAVDATYSYSDIPCAVVTLTYAQSTNSSCVAAPGDSGGPVYSYSGSSVTARGTITGPSYNIMGGYQFPAQCPGVVSNGSADLYYVPLLRPQGDPMTGTLQFYGQGILTG